MPRLRVSTQAVDDVAGIAAYVSQDRPATGRRIGAKLYKTFYFLARHPHIGTARDDVREGLRLYIPGAPASRYVVFFQYNADDDIVEISAVIDGARDWPALFVDPVD